MIKKMTKETNEIKQTMPRGINKTDQAWTVLPIQHQNSNFLPSVSFTITSRRRINLAKYRRL